MITKPKETNSLQELYDLIETAGSHVDWSLKYTNLLITVSNSMFDAYSNPEYLVINKDTCVDQTDVLIKYLEEKGISSNTIATYKSAWGRIVSIVGAWHLHPGNEEDFWKTFSGRFKDKRIDRRRVKRIATSTFSSPVPMDLSNSSIYRSPTNGGDSLLILSNELTSSEALELIQVINNHLSNG
jgi:hypothetical protein